MTPEQREWDLCLACARHAPTTGSVVVKSSSILAVATEIEHLRAAITEALDMGEPVAWTDRRELNWAQKYSGSPGKFYAYKIGDNEIPLYAAKEPK